MRFLSFLLLGCAACVSDVVAPPLDGGSPDTAITTDAGTMPCRTIPNGMGVQCGASACPPAPNPTPKCCLGDTGMTHMCVGTNVACQNFVWACDKPADCMGQSCCGTNPGTSGTCPIQVTLPMPGRNTHCAQTCAANDVRLCATNADCAMEATKKSCVPAVFEGDLGKTVGICQ